MKKSASEVLAGLTNALTSVSGFVDSELGHTGAGASRDECFDIITFGADLRVGIRLDETIHATCRHFEAVVL